MPIIDHAGYVLSVSKAFVSSRKGSSHPTQDVLKTKKTKPQCVAATSALTALGFPQLLSKECLFQFFIHGVQILFSCDEDNAPKLLQYWSLLQKMLYTLVLMYV